MARRTLEEMMRETDLSLQNFNMWIGNHPEETRLVQRLLNYPSENGELLERFLSDLHGEEITEEIIQKLKSGCLTKRETKFFYIIEYNNEEIKIPRLMINEE